VHTYHSVQLDALGDATRRAIVERLVKEGPLPVVEIARAFPMSRPAISQHLRVLKRANLVSDQAEGARRLYAVNPESLASLRTFFDRFWGQALIAFKRRAEESARKKRKQAGP
jgi:DNA-binding transcriptional ArsR family regulator